MFATAAVLGLVVGDDIDALIVRDSLPTGVLERGDVIYVSLTPGSPTLGTLGASAASVIEVYPAAAPVVIFTPFALGLLAGDDVDGLTAIDPGGEPCTQCEPNDHWIDACPGGMDLIGAHGAVVKIDFILDCMPDATFLLEPCGGLLIERSEPNLTMGHVIETEIVSMCLSGGGITLRAGQGQGGIVMPSLGTIIEQPTDSNVADSIFEVFFEIDLGDGMKLYNHDPLIMGSEITCIPPRAIFVSSDCIALYDDPVGGVHMANVVSAKHMVNLPLPDLHATVSGSEPNGTFVEFGTGNLPAIPADFFGPGSDPFTGQIELDGFPFDPLAFGDADTIIQRSYEPVSPSLGEPNAGTVEIEIIELSLISIQPITVTYNGGQDPEEWFVDVRLSDTPSPPGELT